MSETQTGRETEYIAGTIEGFKVHKPGTWIVEVKPADSSAKSLWTKNADLVQSLSAKLGQHGGFVCGVSHYTRKTGEPGRSLWINEAVEDERLDDLHIRQNANAGQAAPSTVSANDAMTKAEWAAKDAAIHHMAAIKAACAALTHTIPSEPTKEQLNDFVSNVLLIADQLQRVVISKRDGEEVPFDENAWAPPLSEHDQAIPF